MIRSSQTTTPMTVKSAFLRFRRNGAPVLPTSTTTNNVENIAYENININEMKKKNNSSSDLVSLRQQRKRFAFNSMLNETKNLRALDDISSEVTNLPTLPALSQGDQNKSSSSAHSPAETPNKERTEESFDPSYLSGDYGEDAVINTRSFSNLEDIFRSNSKMENDRSSFWTSETTSMLSLKRANPVYDSDSESDYEEERLPKRRSFGENVVEREPVSTTTSLYNATSLNNGASRNFFQEERGYTISSSFGFGSIPSFDEE